jgi:hypothetical protein
VTDRGEGHAVVTDRGEGHAVVTDRGGVGALVVAATALAALVLAAPFAVQRLAPESTAGAADAETIGTNRLGAAIVELALQSNSDQGGPSTTTNAAVFSAEGFAPGDLAAGQLTIRNTGDLPIVYELALSSIGGLLAEWLEFTIWQADEVCDPAQPDPETVRRLVLATETASGSGAAGEIQLMPGQRAEMCIGSRLPLDAPNEIQGQELEVTIIVTASQQAGGDG